uniref:Gamma carbonic anhydrase n=1 Tax=Tetradesmus obliquus TaxID=3088 RepID=A0A383W0Z5_TETOB|eukprot:jgi/Sobl393_1/18956/SZX70714.1
MGPGSGETQYSTGTMPFTVVHLGRHPKPKDLIGKAMYALGGMMRGLGTALDSIGVVVQGPYARHDHLVPNTAWMPFEANADIKPAAGAQQQVPFNPRLRESPALDIVAPLKKGSAGFVAPNAKVIGNVSLGSQVSIWYGAVLRGDINAITVGDKTNIQDNVVVHVARHSLTSAPAGGPKPTVIGSAVTIGHGATLHACTIGDGCLVGMGATLLDGVMLEPGSIVGAGAVVPPGAVVKSGEIWAGAPAKLLRKLSAEEKGFVAASADNYAKLATEHRIENGKLFEEVFLDAAIAEEREWRSLTDIDLHMGIARDDQTQLVLATRG